MSSIEARERDVRNGRLRVRGGRALAKRRVVETLIAPATWVLAALGLVIAFFLVQGFVLSLDSSGIDFTRYPPYELVYGIVGSAFGVTYVRQLFGAGPLEFASFIAVAPLLLVLCFGSIQRFGFERRAGMVELVTAGPVDVPTYLLSFGIADLFIAAGYLAALGLYLAGCALAWNLVVGPAFVVNLVGLLLFAAALDALALACAAALAHAASALALFVAIAALLGFVEVASFGLLGDAATSASWALRWISPFYYLDLGRLALRSGSAPTVLAALAGQTVLAMLFAAAARVVARVRGPR